MAAAASTDSASLVQAIETLAQTTIVTQACTLAAITLLLYETCYTADLEVAYIWARGRARMISVFITIRHVQLVGLILNSISYAFVSPKMCSMFSVVNAVVVVIPYFGWACFLGWRAYALSSSSVPLGLVVFLSSVSFVVPSLVTMIWTTPSYDVTTQFGPVCIATWNSARAASALIYLLYFSRTATVLAEMVVFGLTCWTTYREWLSSRTSSRPRSLADVLYENGFICFLVGTVLHAFSLALILNKHTQVAFADTESVFRDAFITVFLSRFMLELGRLGAQANDTDQGIRATKGILTTEWTGDITGVSSQWSLDDEYNGRRFDKDIDTFDLKECYEA